MADSIVTITTGNAAATQADDSLIQPSATLLFDDWYPALRADQLSAKKMTTALLLGIPLVLGRKQDGTLFALRDSCPHRGIPLSCGWFDGNHVTCKYHGWAFEPGSGQCKEIPSLTPSDTLDPSKIYAGAYPCVERDGYAWVYLPGPGRGRLPSRDEALAAPSQKSQSSVTASAPPTSPPTCPATSITASSASWTRPTAPSSTSPGGGAARAFHP